MLQVNDLSVCYGSRTVVDKVSFSVEEGQWLMIVGPNGAGKSTILNALTMGVPYTGMVNLLGSDLRTLKPVQRARIMGTLAQNHFVGYEFTVEEVVQLGRYAHSRGLLSGGDDADDLAVQEALRETGMSKLRHQSVLTLSGGELQRTFLAQALAQNPRILLLDEPTNHLDLKYQKQVFELVSQWVKMPGRAVISVVHDLSLAKAFGTHALLLNRGKAVAVGSAQAVLQQRYLDCAYEMDVSAWMSSMLRQWEP